MTHVIRQQYLHARVDGTESDALALQRNLSALCRNWLAPAIERALDRVAPPVGNLCIERLEIDVGTVQLDRLERDLPESVAQGLEKALREQIPPEASWPGAGTGNIRHKTRQRCVADAFSHFLTTGCLPWSFRLPKGSTLEQLLLGCGRERASLAAVTDALACASARDRLVRQFSPAFLENLLSLLSPEAGKIMAGLLRTLTDSGLAASERKSLERHLWQTVFAQLAAGRVPTARHLAGAVRDALPAAAKGYAPLRSALERHLPGAGGKAAATGDAPLAPNATASAPENLPSSRQPPGAPADHPEAGEGIYIENAGAILLHPFLPQLFETLGIAAKDKLLKPERALCLLHFLTTGQAVAPEYELPLPKILCGLALQTPVDADVALTAGEREEALAVLAAVVGHWDALRDSSADALRGTFLLRPGKISLRHGDWLLQVQSETCDILLDRLPWGISAVRLPWMAQMLWVEWR